MIIVFSSSQAQVYALVYALPRGSAGDSRGNERCFDQSFAMAVRGKYPGFASYRQKGQ